MANYWNVCWNMHVRRLRGIPEGLLRFVRFSQKNAEEVVRELLLAQLALVEAALQLDQVQEDVIVGQCDVRVGAPWGPGAASPCRPIGASPACWLSGSES